MVNRSASLIRHKYNTATRMVLSYRIGHLQYIVHLAISPLAIGFGQSR